MQPKQPLILLRFSVEGQGKRILPRSQVVFFWEKEADIYWLICTKIVSASSVFVFVNKCVCVCVGVKEAELETEDQ